MRTNICNFRERCSRHNLYELISDPYDYNKINISGAYQTRTFATR